MSDLRNFISLNSGLFDGSGYLNLYPDVKESGMDPWFHYRTFGHDEHRLIAVTTAGGTPVSGLFDPIDYVNQYPDLIDAKVDGWIHYRDHGHDENRNAVVIPSGLAKPMIGLPTFNDDCLGAPLENINLPKIF